MKHTIHEENQVISAIRASTVLRRALIGVIRFCCKPIYAHASFALIALLVSTVGVAPASAATLTVTNTGDSGAGSLRAAIASAGSADTIIFDSALSGSTIYLATTLDLTNANNVTIDGSALAAQITLSGDTDNNGVGDVGVFYVQPGATATLNSLKITKGYSNGFGGGIKNYGTLAVSNSTLSSNSAFYGGGISNNGGGALMLTNSTVSGNSGTYGGGIYSNGALTITNSVLSDNSAANTGGGIYAIDSSPFTMTIINSTISGNASASSGGGIWSAETLTITNSTLSGNSAAAAGNGGGIWSGNTMTIHNSTFLGNFASGNGGAIHSARALTVINSTLAGNNAAGSGGGIYVYETTANLYNTSIVFNGADADADMVGSAGGIYNNDGLGANSNLRNTLLAGNTVGTAVVYDDCTGTLNSYGRNLFWDVTGCTVNTATGSWTFLNALGGLGPLQNNGGPTMTVALLPGSNAIDGGDPVLGCTDANGNALATDQRGLARVLGSFCDIGAYEYQYNDLIFANGFE